MNKSISSKNIQFSDITESGVSKNTSNIKPFDLKESNISRNTKTNSKFFSHSPKNSIKNMRSIKFPCIKEIKSPVHKGYSPKSKKNKIQFNIEEEKEEEIGFDDNDNSFLDDSLLNHIKIKNQRMRSESFKSKRNLKGLGNIQVSSRAGSN